MLIIGHRGARGLAPENTLASFQAALDYGVDAIECDVRVTQDDVVVLVHNKKSRNHEGAELAIRQHSYADLKQHNPDLVTLDEAISFVDRRTPLYIEIKPRTAIEPIAAVVEGLLAKKWQPEDFRFVSFDYQVLKAMQTHFPDITLVVNDMWSGLRACSRANRLGTKFIDLYTPIIWGGFVKFVSRRGYQLYTFPQNNVKQSQRWAKLGLAGVITDYPDRFGPESSQNPK